MRHETNRPPPKTIINSALITKKKQPHTQHSNRQGEHDQYRAQQGVENAQLWPRRPRQKKIVNANAPDQIGR
jgi:hypothetical protein